MYVENLYRAFIFAGRVLQSGAIVLSCFFANSVLSCLFLSIIGVALEASNNKRFKGLCRRLFGCLLLITIILCCNSIFLCCAATSVHFNLIVDYKKVFAHG